ncbi:MAG: DUF2585 family protein [Promethearchaeota archaeon]
MSESESTSEVGRAWIDYFTWGHVAMGILFYTLTWFIVSLTPAIGRSYIAFIVTMIIGCWIWEVLENNVFLAWGIKFEDKKDSINNLLGDQMFVVVGAIVMWLFEIIIIGNYETYWFFIVAAIGLVVCLIGFLVGRAINKSKNNGS